MPLWPHEHSAVTKLRAACPMQPLDDLLWAVNSQPLLNASPLVDPVDVGEIDHDHFAEFLREQSDHRVGRYFERLILYWLTHIRKVQIVHHSKQILDAKRTIGEIDFIFRDESHRLTHWETAIKFYLYDPLAQSFSSQFIGPNAADNFEKKTAKMFAKQLPLSKNHFPEVEVREAFVKGRVFYHPDQPKPTTLPKYLSPGHLTGRWIRAAELDYLNQADPKSIFQIQQKPNWLTAQRPTAGKPRSLSSTELVDQLKSHFDELGHPVLVSEHSKLDEAKWIFVVPDSWPNENN